MVFFIIAATAVTIPASPVRAAYFWNVVRPAQESRFGFAATWDEASGCFQVSEIASGGAFANAGVKPGDVPYAPSCFGITVIESFYSELAHLPEGKTVTLLFLENVCMDESAQLAIK
ncbi:MAG: hypothetical protein ACRD2J_11385, partial [Thermoanaerobaculia bacterium]